MGGARQTLVDFLRVLLKERRQLDLTCEWELTQGPPVKAIQDSEVKHERITESADVKDLMSVATPSIAELIAPPRERCAVVAGGLTLPTAKLAMEMDNLVISAKELLEQLDSGKVKAALAVSELRKLRKRHVNCGDVVGHSQRRRRTVQARGQKQRGEQKGAKKLALAKKPAS
mmetsp:Transcript_33214/g.74295  ORF Transcript_33214/g.74295 Transcript_33214/m.74295 type:complete len:173 (+) Transcript_33214:21-539(+)